ncbi:A24 family peptidase [Brevibacillus choshinensis]|uniref:A24 family peptidase n=1 Tax=Brevibacillus choshinensis TaxID=54911 RepID=UPI002E21ADA3|nr:A24 family peptidase [Brevibacillus choshinensis]MED4754005.1 A24 family peptidase [Brevibacillus choshinensis]MED4779136.1 A24 family peptidase [Brevibacillus choshinensis]
MGMTWILIVVFIYVSWTDVRYRRIPNRALLTGLLLVAGIGCVIWPKELWMAHFGVGVGVVATFGLVAWFWPERIGMGDVKLLGLLGFAIGLRPFVLILTSACLLILLVFLFLLLAKRIGWQSSLPFAPFVTVGLLLYHASI